jgi:Zn-dependent protease/CBS domain-containing protein
VTAARSQLTIGRLFGIRIVLHFSWFVIALLIVMSLGQHFEATNPGWSPALTWTTAVLTGMLFFVAIVLHELSHALVARARGLPVQSITLFALGGIAQIEREASDSRTEFWMGLAGPIASVVIGAACLGSAMLVGWQPNSDPVTPPEALLVWLGYINISLAVFNMIPGFPLDGGRVLRAVIWWITGNEPRATRLAARIGQVVAFGFIVLGIFRFLWGGGLGGLWIAFIGWFLLNAAGASHGQVETLERLRGVRVGDVMIRDCVTVDGHLSLQGFVENYLLRTGRHCFVVVDDGAVTGLVTPYEVKEVQRAKWPSTLVEDIMKPLFELKSVSPDTPVAESLETMGKEDLQQLPVVSEGRLQGIISRASILQFLRTRAELKI